MSAAQWRPLEGDDFYVAAAAADANEFFLSFFFVCFLLAFSFAFLARFDAKAAEAAGLGSWRGMVEDGGASRGGSGRWSAAAAAVVA